MSPRRQRSAAQGIVAEFDRVSGRIGADSPVFAATRQKCALTLIPALSFGLALLWCVLPAVPVRAQILPDTVTPFTMPSARQSALGGYHTAFSESFETLFANPACLFDAEPQKSFAEVSFSMVDFGILDLLFSSEDMNAKFRNLVLDGIEIAMDLGGPVAFGSIKNNGGWGVFNVSRLHIQWERDAIWKPLIKASEEVFFLKGHSFRFMERGSITGDIGFTLKAFYRFSFLPDLFLHEIKNILEDITRDIVESQLGVGSDVGLRFTFGPTFSAGLMFHDLLSPVFVAEFRNMARYYEQKMVVNGLMWLPRRLALGMAWHFSLPFWSPFITDIVVTADYNQALPFLDYRSRYWMLEIGLGMEICFFEVFYLRAGLSEMLPAFGAGFDFMVFKLDAAFAMRELGRKPGEYRTYAANVSVLFRY